MTAPQQKSAFGRKIAGIVSESALLTVQIYVAGPSDPTACPCHDAGVVADTAFVLFAGNVADIVVAVFDAPMASDGVAPCGWREAGGRGEVGGLDISLQIVRKREYGRRYTTHNKCYAAGTGDHDRPEWLVTINGIRTYVR